MLKSNIETDENMGENGITKELDHSNVRIRKRTEIKIQWTIINALTKS